MAFDVREALTGKFLDGGVQGVVHDLMGDGRTGRLGRCASSMTRQHFRFPPVPPALLVRGL